VDARDRWRAWLYLGAMALGTVSAVAVALWIVCGPL